MREAHDFSGAARGKHYRACRAGHTVRIHKASGATEVHHFTQETAATTSDILAAVRESRSKTSPQRRARRRG